VGILGLPWPAVNAGACRAWLLLLPAGVALRTRTRGAHDGAGLLGAAQLLAAVRSACLGADRLPHLQRTRIVSELRLETMEIPAADLGPENPLPALENPGDVHATKPEGTGIPDEMLENMAYARIPNILPYTLQDGYNRRRRRRGLSVAVLENDTLRATFALELGGRLWSLVH